MALCRYTTAVIVNNQSGQVNVATAESRQTNVVRNANTNEADQSPTV